MQLFKPLVIKFIAISSLSSQLTLRAQAQNSADEAERFCGYLAVVIFNSFTQLLQNNFANTDRRSYIPSMESSIDGSELYIRVLPARENRIRPERIVRDEEPTDEEIVSYLRERPDSWFNNTQHIIILGYSGPLSQNSIAFFRANFPRIRTIMAARAHVNFVTASEPYLHQGSHRYPSLRFRDILNNSDGFYFYESDSNGWSPLPLPLIYNSATFMIGRDTDRNAPHPLLSDAELSDLQIRITSYFVNMNHRTRW